MNEIDAVKEIKKGNKKAFRYLFDLYYDRLVAYVVTYSHDKMSSEDIVQQAFVDLWNDRSKLDAVRSPKNYLYTIARNRYFDSIRKKKRSAKLFGTFYEKALRDRIEEDTATIESRIKKMNLIINSLPPRCQEILKMSKVQGMKYKEIAAILGISIKTVEKQISIAFKKIRKAFKDDILILFLIRNVFLTPTNHQNENKFSIEM